MNYKTLIKRWRELADACRLVAVDNSQPTDYNIKEWASAYDLAADSLESGSYLYVALEAGCAHITDGRADQWEYQAMSVMPRKG